MESFITAIIPGRPTARGYTLCMATLIDVLNLLRLLAPEESALDDDPVGLLVGVPRTRAINRIGVCLDATLPAVTRAAEMGADLVIAHHPLIYHALKRIAPETDGISAAVAVLIKADVGLYAMHTNWDRAPGGINDTLARLLGLHDADPLGPDGPLSLPRIGSLAVAQPLGEFCSLVAKTLDCAGTSALRVNSIDTNRPVKRVAVCGGAGAFLMRDAIAAGADTYVTADVRHHEFIEADARGLALIDAGHSATERPGMRELALLLPERLPGVQVDWLE
jgi:dinuclear metal center YbgI/SA1388 family protein